MYSREEHPSEPDREQPAAREIAKAVLSHDRIDG
jgi:hypothetical protein